jgi:putative transposase
MAKATTTIRESLRYQPQHAEWFAANQVLFNRVVAFYFEVIQAHELVLDLSTKEALTALETLTHATSRNHAPVMPLAEIAADIPAYFRRAAINAAMGSARSFSSSRKSWRTRKEKAEEKAKAKRKAKPFRERPPVPPRSWNKSAPFYAGLWKERSGSSILLKVWTGTCWSWVKIRTLGRAVPDGFEMGSPALVRKGKLWWLHTPIEKTFSSPPKIAEQVTKTDTKICAVDLNLNEHLAVCTVQTVEGTILATRFIGGGREISGFRKRQLGRIARNRSQTGIIAEGEQDNADVWASIRAVDSQVAHLVSARIVQFAHAQGASILVFEHLGNLKPEKGTYSHRGNSKRQFWMKGRIFTYAKYKAWNLGIITSRVNPRNTSRECARCHSLIIRYAQGQPIEGNVSPASATTPSRLRFASAESRGYTPGTPLCFCPQCGGSGNAYRNASLVIGRRLVQRYAEPSKEKPHTADRRGGRVSKETGVALSQDAKREHRPSPDLARPGERNAHGTAHKGTLPMEERPFDIPCQLRWPLE